MTLEELVEIVEALRSFRTDLQHVEAKRASGGLPRSVRETLSSFANTNGGGVIILGLDEERGFEATGIADPAKLQADLASMSDEMEPPSRPLITLHQLEGVTLLVAEVQELPPHQKPCYYRGAGLVGGAFIRVADGDRRLSSYEVQLLLSNRGQPKNDESPVPEARLLDLDEDLLRGLLHRRRQASPRFRAMSDPEILVHLKVLVDCGGHLVPSLAGLLALGKSPQSFFPQLGLTFVAYPTPETGRSGPGGERFLDNVRIEGAIPYLLSDTMAALRRNMRRRAIVRGLYREDLWEYPETALREALVNAMGHRDLSDPAKGTPVQVRMYPDRLEIVNPGGLFGAVTIHQLGEAGISSSRNAALMRLLEDLPEPGGQGVICENRASGIGAMLAGLREAGMSPPTFRDSISSFQVTFPNHTLLNEENLAWLSELGVQDLTDSQRMALVMLRGGETLTNGIFRQATGLDSRIATRELGDLVRMGLIEQQGTRGGASYHLHLKPAAAATPPARRPRRSEILGLLSDGVARSRSEIEAELGMKAQNVRLALGELVAQGVLQATAPPKSKHRKYRMLKRS